MGDRMSKPNKKSDVEYTEELDVPASWAELRDSDGELMEGCYRTVPCPDSDSL